MGFVVRFHRVEKLALCATKKLCKQRRNRGNAPHANHAVVVKTRQKVLERGKNTGKIPYMVRFEFLRQFLLAQHIDERLQTCAIERRRASSRAVFNGGFNQKLINESLKVLL